MKIPDCNYFLIDIDGTLTRYRDGVMVHLLHGNFLFPIICDLMVESGWNRTKAESAILDKVNANIFWDYPDFIAEFKLSAPEAFRRFRQWHAENIVPCEDGVKLTKELFAMGKKLLIMSNNPYNGCLLKLQAIGLADDDFSSPYFKRILGTNVLFGCKSDIKVWENAIARIPAEKSDICVVGDNPEEDRDIPRSCGITNSIILSRDNIVHGVEKTGKKQ
ncbi:MAG: HAD hydrolase-like protein [Victivallales bacterium]|jgi:FMN phosphatase YigB (HAD superfamily)|nr:HAD hydrolase-like protein [Victivallales bacterium]